MSIEEQYLYDKSVECPVCGNKFKVTAVKQKGYIVKERDSDFCIYYKEINPLLYDIWICQLCGYAAPKNSFPNISFKRGEFIKEYITPKWTARESERILDYEKAVDQFKLALISAQVSKAKSSEIAGICLKIAWIYRFMEQAENEQQFLQHALDKYLDAYSNERFPLENMDETTVTYLIGELYRRVGNFEEAATWLSKVIASRSGSDRVQKLAKEQWQLIKEVLKTQNNEREN